MAGDTINLSVTLGPSTRMILLTQGSTKIFKSPSLDVVSGQHMTFDLQDGAGLCYLPDPVQPFEKSCFEQTQFYTVRGSSIQGTPRGDKAGGLCALDWVCQGRKALGEDWTFSSYRSKNEVCLQPEHTQSEDEPSTKQRVLLLRDNMVLGPSGVAAASGPTASFASRMDSLAVFGTLILQGPLFTKLGEFFMAEFKLLPRIGGRQWDKADGDEEDEVVDAETAAAELKRQTRHSLEKQDGLLWTVSSMRHCVVVKFGAREVEGGKRWLRSMLETEGSVTYHFGERALLCLR